MDNKNSDDYDINLLPESNLEDRIEQSRIIEDNELFFQLCLRLSSQQLQIALLCRNEFSDARIAMILKTSEKNVKTQKTKIASKIKKLPKHIFGAK